MNLHSIVLDELDLVVQFLAQKFPNYTFTVREDRKAVLYSQPGLTDTLTDYNLRCYIHEMHSKIKRGEWIP